MYLVFEAGLEVIGDSPLSGLSVFECEVMPEEHKKVLILFYDQHMFEDKLISQQKYFFRIYKLQSILDQLLSVSAV